MVPLAIQPSRGEIWGSLLKPPCLSSSMSNQTLTSFTHFLTIFLAPFPFPTIATTFIQVFIVSHSCQHKNQLLLPELKNADWLATCNPEVVLHDDGYKKHLKQHCNK